MDVTDLLSIIKNWKARKIALFFLSIVSLISIISIASADVRLQNTYATTGSETQEGIYLHGVDYSNSAAIYQTSYTASSKTSPSKSANDSRVEDIAYMKTGDGDQGAGLMIDASILNYTRTIAGGESNSIVFSYLADSGNVQLDYFTPLSRMTEDISLNNNSYKGDFAVFNTKSYSLGKGECVVDAQSSFKHNITMRFLDKFSEIRGFLNTGEENAGSFPLKYKWTGYSSQRDSATSGMNIEITPGNRSATSWINGKSSIMAPKFSPDEINGTYKYPLTINEEGKMLWKDGVWRYSANRTLVMQYRLNATGGDFNQDSSKTIE